MKLTHKVFTFMCESFGFSCRSTLKVTIENCGFNVHLMNLWVFNGHYCKDIMNWHKLCNMCKSIVVINSKCLGETSCKGLALSHLTSPSTPCLIFNTHLQEVGILPLGSGTKDQVLLTTRKLYSFHKAISHFFAFLPFNTSYMVWGSFEKLWWLVPLFGGHPPIMRPLLTLSLGFFSLSILLWFIQTFICGGANYSFEEKFDVDLSPSTSFTGLSFKDIGLTSLTSSSSFTTSSITMCFTWVERGLLSWTPLTCFVRSRNITFGLLMILLVFLHTLNNMFWSLTIPC